MKTRILISLFAMTLMLLINSNCFSQEMHSGVTIPKYTGGLSALKEFITKNTADFQSDVSGMVVLSYYVNEKGKVEDVRLMRGLDLKCDAEAVRVAEMIPGWQCAAQFGIPIRAKVIMSVEFKSKAANKTEKDFLVEGYLTDKLTGKPLSGSLILIRGTNIGTMTDTNGHYSLIVPNEDSVIEFSSIGYELNHEKVGKNRTINVALPTHDYVVDFESGELK